MKKLKSKKKLLYDARLGKTSVITTKILNVNVSSYNGEYTANIQDFRYDDSISGVTESEIQITSNIMSFSADEITSAELALGDVYTDTLSERMEAVILTALLLSMTKTPLYGSIPTDWDMI